MKRSPSPNTRDELIANLRELTKYIEIDGAVVAGHPSKGSIKSLILDLESTLHVCDDLLTKI